MNDSKNGVFESKENESSIGETYFWRFDDATKGGFLDLEECAKDYCVMLSDKLPEMRDMYNGSTWNEIYEIAGISEKIRDQIFHQQGDCL